MPWGRVDDNLYDHPKVLKLPDEHRLACVGLLFMAVSWSNRFLTDGVIPVVLLRKLGARQVHVDALIRAGLFDKPDDDMGVVVHDFAHYSKSREQVLRDREAARSRMRSGRSSQDVQPNNGGTSVSVRGGVQLPRPVPSYTRPVTRAPAREGEPSLKDRVGWPES